MNIKWIGAFLVIAGCVAVGYLVSGNYLKREQLLRNLISAMEHMRCELQFQSTPLPQVCRSAGDSLCGVLKNLFHRLGDELDAQIYPDAQACTASVIEEYRQLPIEVRSVLTTIGKSLGKFDLPGQVSGLEAAEAECQRYLSDLKVNRDSKLRSYKAFGICAGAALVIILL